MGVVFPPHILNYLLRKIVMKLLKSKQTNKQLKNLLPNDCASKKTAVLTKVCCFRDFRLKKKNWF